VAPVLGLPVLLQFGCAIHYHDAKTGTEHVWGLAHVKMRVASVDGSPAAPAPNPAAATQVDTFGLGLHVGNGAPGADSGVSLGWDRRTRLLVPDDTALSLEWPTSRLFDVRVGSAPPFPASAAAPTPPTPVSNSP
jgi:hypothetical protein